MKKLSLLLFIALMFNVSSVLAHSGHGKISAKQAIQLAVKLTQKLTFKDLGYKVGKLSDSWKSSTTQDYQLYAVHMNRYIISASNSTDDTSIYFLMTMSGEVLKVNPTAKF